MATVIVVPCCRKRTKLKQVEQQLLLHGKAKAVRLVHKRPQSIEVAAQTGPTQLNLGINVHDFFQDVGPM